MGDPRYASVIDVHVILRRGGRVLLRALPQDTVDYVAAVISAVERGLTFTLNGW